MDEDCLFVIFENLHFLDLLNVAEISDESSRAAAFVFRHKYSSYQLVIRDKLKILNSHDEISKATGVNVDRNAILEWNKYIGKDQKDPLKPDQMELVNSKQVLNTFQYFGRFIRRLKYDVTSRFQHLQVRLFSRLINEYSTESLTDIECSSSQVWQQIEKPLINVENATFAYFYRISDSKSGFTELLPSVRHLKLDRIAFDNDSISYFEHHMPHLEHLSIKQYQFEYERNPLTDVIVKNPQIRSFSMLEGNNNFLRQVNAILPRLEVLECKLQSYSISRSIRFANVTTLIMLDRDEITPRNLYFPSLQILRVTRLPKWMRGYIDFINQHRHLRQLYLGADQMHDTQFQQLTENLNDLVELTIGFDKPLKAHESQELQTNIVADFLRDHDQMLRFNVINSAHNWNLELKNRLINEWNTKIDDNSISCERNINI